MPPPSPNLDEIKQQLNPIISFTYIASQILLAMYRSSQILIPILPVLLSSIAFFSYFPFLVQHHAFFTKAIVASISIIAGYFQYNSLKQDEARDQKIINHECEIQALKQQLKSLQHLRKHTTTSLNSCEPKPALLIPRPASTSALSDLKPTSEKKIRHSH